MAAHSKATSCSLCRAGAQDREHQLLLMQSELTVLQEQQRALSTNNDKVGPSAHSYSSSSLSSVRKAEPPPTGGKRFEAPSKL